MDSHKDKTNTSQVSDNQKSLATKDFDTSLFISKDKNFSYTHQKVKKLAAAVYMITNFFDDHEPLKWSLRSLSTELLKRNIAANDIVFANAEDAKEKIRETVLETVSLLEVGSFAGLVSSMNVAVLKKEFNELLEKMNSMAATSQKNDAEVTERFFHTDEPAPKIPQSNHERTEAHDNSITYIKDNSNVSESKHQEAAQHIRHEEENTREQKVVLKDFSPVAVKKNKRQSTIINLIKRKHEIMIKDVVGLIHDCSEKTIQRELLALVDEGILKKEGSEDGLAIAWSNIRLSD